MRMLAPRARETRWAGSSRFSKLVCRIGGEELRQLARGRGVHPLETSCDVVDCRRLGDLIENRACFGDLAHRALVQERVVERESRVAADLRKERNLFLAPIAALRA